MSGLVRAALAGTGAAVPPRTIKNADLEKILDTSDEWIVSRTGIRERHVVERAGPGGLPPGQAGGTTALAVEASRRALEAAGCPPGAVDLIVVGTCTPDFPVFPATAPLLAAELGAARAWGFDVSLACTGFVAALMVAEKFVATGTAERALVVGVDTMSSIIDWTDRNTSVIFGDGAGAALVRPLGPDGRGEILFSSLGMGGNSEVLRVDPATHTARMKGRETYRFAVKMLVQEIERAAGAAGKRPADLAAVIPHQVNQRIIEAAVERLGMPIDRVVIDIDRYGNTSAGSVPIALDEAARSGRLAPGDLVCLVGFGAGLAWGSALLRW